MKHFFLGIVVGGIFFWDASVWTIGKECVRVGGFYYVDKIYKCEPKQ